GCSIEVSCCSPFDAAIASALPQQRARTVARSSSKIESLRTPCFRKVETLSHVVTRHCSQAARRDLEAGSCSRVHASKGISGSHVTEPPVAPARLERCHPPTPRIEQSDHQHPDAVHRRKADPVSLRIVEEEGHQLARLETLEHADDHTDNVN